MTPGMRQETRMTMPTRMSKSQILHTCHLVACTRRYVAGDGMGTKTTGTGACRRH